MKVPFNLLCLSLSLFSLISSGARGAVCDVHPKVEENINFTALSIELPQKKIVTLVGVDQAPTEIAQAFLDELREGKNLQEDLPKMLGAQKQVVDSLKASLEFLREQMQSNPPAYLAFESKPEAMRTWKNLADELYVGLWPTSIHGGVSVDLLNQAVLTILAAPMFLKEQSPELFEHTKIIGFGGALSSPLTAVDLSKQQGQEQGQESANSASTSEGEAPSIKEATAQTLDELSQFSRTPKEFRDFVKSFNPDSRKYKGKSNKTIKRQVLRTFYKPARPAISKWLDVRLASENSKVTPLKKSAAKSKVLPPQPISPFAEETFSQNGNGLLYFSKSLLEPIKETLVAACKARIKGH